MLQFFSEFTLSFSLHFIFTTWQFIMILIFKIDKMKFKKIITRTIQKLNQEARHYSFVLKKKKKKEKIKVYPALKSWSFKEKQYPFFFKLGKNFSFKSILSSLITNAKVSWSHRMMKNKQTNQSTKETEPDLFLVSLPGPKNINKYLLRYSI